MRRSAFTHFHQCTEVLKPCPYRIDIFDMRSLNSRQPKMRNSVLLYMKRGWLCTFLQVCQRCRAILQCREDNTPFLQCGAGMPRHFCCGMWVPRHFCYLKSKLEAVVSDPFHCAPNSSKLSKGSGSLCRKLFDTAKASVSLCCKLFKTA